jgi:hypothetical protein
MSLKIEQKIENNQLDIGKKQIYTTGARLVPLKIIKNGKERYVWIVDEFDSDCFDNTGECINVNVYANNEANLIVND